jgi:chromosome partitioning protein
MQTIALVNQKGGVGKTTTAVTLAHGLALRGYLVLLVDLDAQGNVADSLGLQKRGDLYRFLIDAAGIDAITPCGVATRENLDVILADKTTAAAKQILAGQSFREQVLKRALGRVAGTYEFCILDCAPGVDVLQVAALVAADWFLVPVGLDHLAVVGAGDALASAASLADLGGPHARFLGILPTMWERTTNESHQQLQLLVDQFKRLVWPPIPEDVKAREAPAHGATLWEYAPHTRALDGVEINGNGGRVGGYVQVLARLLQEIGDERA